MSRHRLGDMLDNLGQRIREFDNAYATRVRGMIEPPQSPRDAALRYSASYAC